MTTSKFLPSAAIASSFSFLRMQAWITSGWSFSPWIGWLNDFLPMSRLTNWATDSERTADAFLASLPTITSVFSNSTALGVSRSPSVLRTTWVRPLSSK